MSFRDCGDVFAMTIEGNTAYCFDEALNLKTVVDAHNFYDADTIEAAGIKERLPDGKIVTRCLNALDMRVGCTRRFGNHITGFCALAAANVSDEAGDHIVVAGD